MQVLLLTYNIRKYYPVYIVIHLVYSINSFSQSTENNKFRPTSFSKDPYGFGLIKNSESATNDYIGFYQKYISGIRGQECPMYPSCSNFGKKVFNERAFASAMILTSDRLLRCGHDHDNYPLTLKTTGFKYLDLPGNEMPSKEHLYTKNVYYYAFSDTIEDDSSVTLVKNLINSQMHQLALLEIFRIETQKGPFDFDLFLNKLVCLRALQENEKVIYEYEVKCPEPLREKPELLYQVAVTYFDLDNFSKAIEYGEKGLKGCSELYLQAKFYLLIGLSQAKKDDWPSAFNSYQMLSKTEHPLSEVGKTNYKIAMSIETIKWKSPIAASLFSVVPGAGYLYTGHGQTALSALLINGLLAYATYTSFQNKNYGIGILTGIFNLSFYLGNIYGAKQSAIRFNYQKKRNIINKLNSNSTL
jgi:putative component of membrane protein insertase Oxa1/YidC/SpoIIIJ protein YidD